MASSLVQLLWRKEKPVHQSSSFFIFFFLLGFVMISGIRGESECQQLQGQEIPKLAPCQSYVQVGNTSTPGSECCTPLMQVMSSAGECFCNLTAALQQFVSVFPSINKTRSNGLLGLCNIPIPPQAATCGTGNSSSSSGPSSPSSGNSSSTTSRSNGCLIKPFTMPIATFLLALPLYW